METTTSVTATQDPMNDYFMGIEKDFLITCFYNRNNKDRDLSIHFEPVSQLVKNVLGKTILLGDQDSPSEPNYIFSDEQLDDLFHDVVENIFSQDVFPQKFFLDAQEICRDFSSDYTKGLTVIQQLRTIFKSYICPPTSLPPQNCKFGWEINGQTIIPTAEYFEVFKPSSFVFIYPESILCAIDAKSYHDFTLPFLISDDINIKDINKKDLKFKEINYNHAANLLLTLNEKTTSTTA